MDDARRARFKLIIGGAHPEGQLSSAERERLQTKLTYMRSPEARRIFAEVLENIYYEHGESVLAQLRKYSQTVTALTLNKHITFVELQNEILDGEREGPVDDECARLLFASFMDYFRQGILEWASMYEDLDYRPGAD